MKPILSLLFISCLAFVTIAQESVDLEAINKIRQEGLENSHIEEIAFMLTDQSGPRLANSPGYNRAAKLAVDQLKRWGLENAATEAWGEYGKGWEVKKSYIAMTKPYYVPLIAVPNAWTGSTSGVIKQQPIIVNVSSEDEIANYKGKLAGAIVMMDAGMGDQGPTFEPDGLRISDEELEEMANDPGEQAGGEMSEERQQRIARWRARAQLRDAVNQLIEEEGVAMVIQGSRGRHGTLWTGSNRSAREAGAPIGVSEVRIVPEHFKMIQRLLEHGIDVEIEAEVITEFYDDDLQGYNVIAEIPGSDPNLKEEIVMLGGHLDSWHGATGATDNASGCAVMMEAVRILQATDLKPKRTIRIALWGGEEQGLHGSRNYVKNHFGDPETMVLKPEHEKVSAYYNIDNGTGRIRGIYLQGNEKVRPIFDEWFKPYDDIIDNRTITIQNTGGTDHLSFDALSIPGFQFIQDPVEYDTRTHHTNMDTYERLVMDDLKQMAVIVAGFVYQTAQRDEMLPREDLPAVESR